MTGHIFIDGEIGEKTTPDSVRNNIAQYPQAKDWEVHVNSPGGDVYDGYQIGNLISALPKTTAIIGSQCASISTYITCSCDKVIMGPHGDYTIHDPTGGTFGKAQDLRGAADQLDRIKREIIDKYTTKVSKKGVTPAQLSDMMDKETSMSPSEALAMGFIDEVQEKFKAVAKIDLTKFKMEKDKDKSELKGLFAEFKAEIVAMFGKPKAKLKAKNSVPVMLEDGTALMSDAADPADLMGSTITNSDGSPIAPNSTLVLQDGSELTCDENGMVTDVEAGTPSNDDSTDDEDPEAMTAMKAENEALKAQIAQMQANAAKTTSEAVAKVEKTFKAQLETFTKKVDELEKKTFGAPGGPKDAPKNLDDDDVEVDESMAAFGNDITNFYKSRNIITEKK